MKRGLEEAEQVAGENCQFFAKTGWCKHGDNCKYAHEFTPDTPVQIPGGSGEQCQFFVKTGWCKHGDNCHHIHEGGPEGGPIGKPEGMPGGSGEVCQFFTKTGWCKHGDACHHVHVGQAAQPPAGGVLVGAALRANGGAPVISRPAAGGAVATCNFFAGNGWCKHGDNCNHIHPGQPTAGNPGGSAGVTGEVCQFFAKAGWCKHGANCNHIHGGGKGGKGAPAPAAGAAKAGGQGGKGVVGKGAPMVGKGGVVRIAAPAPSAGTTGEICQFFAKAGWCKHGDGCNHLHVAGGGGVVPPDAKRFKGAPGGAPQGKGAAPAQSSGEICQFFAKHGWCQHAENCRHVHADIGERVEVEASGEACQHFVKAGWCKFGDSCKHSHELAA